MRATQYLLISTMFVSGCALAPAPEVPMSPPAVEVLVPLPAAPIERVEVTLLPRLWETESLAPFRQPTPPGKKGLPAPTPLQIVSQAHRAARLEPTERGYFGASGEQVYAWAPGKIFTVYLSPKQGTGIFLPPGERLVSGLYLDAEAFEVKTERAGAESAAYDALTVRPLTASGEVETFLLTESGRRYLLRFVVGTTGMLAVTFEGPQVSAPRLAPETALVLPRPIETRQDAPPGATK
jgi:hypothetical protein